MVSSINETTEIVLIIVTPDEDQRDFTIEECGKVLKWTVWLNIWLSVWLFAKLLLGKAYLFYQHWFCSINIQGSTIQRAEIENRVLSVGSQDMFKLIWMLLVPACASMHFVSPIQLDLCFGKSYLNAGPFLISYFNIRPNSLVY